MAERRPSDEILNAFVDGQFSPEDRLHTLQFIAANERLSREICDLHQLKELVRSAYTPEVLPRPRSSSRRSAGSARRDWTLWRRDPAGTAPPPAPDPDSGSARRWVGPFTGRALVYPVVLVLAGFFGYYLAMVTYPTEVLPPRVALEPLPSDPGLSAGHVAASGLPPSTGMTASGMTATGVEKVLFHVTHIGMQEAERLLDDIDFLFANAAERNQELVLQVIIHGESMDLVRADIAPFPERIQSMLAAHSGLRILACAQSQARIIREEGRPVVLLPSVEWVESGPREAALRQLEGWAYIRL